MQSRAAQGPRRDYFIMVGATALGLVIALVVTALVGYASATKHVERAFAIKQAADTWLATVLECQASARSFVMSGGSDRLQLYETAARSCDRDGALLRQLAADNRAQIDNISYAAKHARAALADAEALVRLAESGQRDEAIRRLNAASAPTPIESFREGVARIQSVERLRLHGEHTSASRRGAMAAMAALMLGLAASLLLGLAYSLRRNRARTLERAAAESRRRLRALSDLAAALSATHTCAEVSAVVLEHGTRAFSAGICTLHLLNAKQQAFELIGDRGVAPAVLDRIRQIEVDSAGYLSGPLWAENQSDYKALLPAIEGISAEGPRARAFWSMPLVVEGRTVGILGMGFYRPRTFSEEERAFAETLAQQCAQALFRAVRLESEDQARRWLTTTLFSIGDGVIATDATGDIAFMNPIAESLTGWTEKEARGRKLDEVFAIHSEQTGEPMESPVGRVLREGTVVGLGNHTVLHAKSGFHIPIDDSGAPIRGEDGRMLGVVLVFRDATRGKRERERREFLARAGEALVSSSLDYQATLATVARLAVPIIADWCAVDLKDDDRKPTYQAAVAHVDPKKVELARKLGERYRPDPNALSGAPQVIRTGKAELYAEIPAKLLEGPVDDPEQLLILRQLQLRSAMIVPLRGRTRIRGAMTFVYAESGRRYTRDDLEFAQNFADRAGMAIENAIALRETEEAHIEERRLRGQSELASRAKDEFLAMVSHELRTPLNAILGWTVILRRRNPADEIDRGLSVIERNARTQAKLIEDVLDISRIISGKLLLSLGPTNISDAVSAAVETVTPAAEGKGISIEIEPIDTALVITADPNRVQQIMWNLLSNAVKFTPKGGKVKVRGVREGSDVRLCVKDSGEGIRREVLPLIFEPFHQADASTTRRHGGLGLGLAIVRQLVSAHGGTVNAESDGPGQGASFSVRLPARSAVPAVIRTSPATTRFQMDRLAVTTAQSGPRLDGLRLLIVDDERDALMLVGEVLREQGAEVHLADSAADALDRLAAVRPDVIVSDIGMPETDGYGLIRRIRALPAGLGGSTPAIALTAYARAEDAQRALAAGFQMFVPKPVEPSELVGVVADLGSGARA